MLALLLFSPVSALPSPKSLAVPETNAIIVVDGSLDMYSEWNCSAVAPWYNPLGGYELDMLYFLHNETHYMIAASLYDPDNKADDYVSLSVKWGSIVYMYNVSEHSSSITAYNVTGSASLSSNATAFLTWSKYCHRIYLEMLVPKAEWEESSTVYVYFEHVNTHKLRVVSKFPEDSDPSDTNTWLKLTFERVLGQYGVEMHFKDRDGGTIEYVANDSYVSISFLNGTIYTVLVPLNSTVKVDLPPENYTFTFYVYDIPVFNATLNVTGNITATYTLKNLKHVLHPLGHIVAVVELPGEIGGIDLEPHRQTGFLISNSTQPIALRVFPGLAWNYTFVTVLNALNFTYNPFTGNLLAFVKGNQSGIMMIGAPEGYPVVYYCNGTVKGYVYDHEAERLCMWVRNGTLRVYHDGEPFAIALNGSALKRGEDYTVDPFNITTIKAQNGDLAIFYARPTRVSLATTGSTLRITVAAPYSFNGEYTVKIRSSGSTIKTKSGLFTSSMPLTVIDVPLDGLDPGSYTIDVTVVDRDSQKVVGSGSTSYTVSIIQPITEIPPEHWLLICLTAIIAVIAIILAYKASSKAAIEYMEKKRKFIKRKT